MTTVFFLATLVGVGLALGAIMAGAWVVWRRSGNAGWVDTIWTFGLGTVGLFGALLPMLADGERLWRQYLVAGLIAIWALRLGVHIARRTRAITDDPRYAKLLQGWGGEAARRMFWLLQKQALVSIPLGLAILLAAWNPDPAFRFQDMLAVLVLIVAVAGEAVADAQLRGFRADPSNAGRICEAGLWRWSRHPNYFFEWFGWLAYPLLAVDFSGAYPWGWVALAGPACMYWLLVHVSGIPPLEEHMLETRGQAFRAYQARTNAFVPLPPRERTT